MTIDLASSRSVSRAVATFEKALLLFTWFLVAAAGLLDVVLEQMLEIWRLCWFEFFETKLLFCCEIARIL